MIEFNMTSSVYIRENYVGIWTRSNLEHLLICLSDWSSYTNTILACHGTFGPGDQNSRNNGLPGPFSPEKFGPGLE